MPLHTSSSAPALVWFREDLRVHDNTALHEAVQTGRPVLAFYVLDEDSAGVRPLGGASKWWLHGSLAELSQNLGKLGLELFLFKGACEDVLTKLVSQTQAGAVFWNRRYTVPEIEIDARLKTNLTGQGVEVHSFNGRLFNEPWEVKNKSGDPFKVFSPYWRASLAKGEPPAPLDAPRAVQAGAWPEAVRALAVPLDDLKLEPHHPDWAGGMRAFWQRGEGGAHKRLHAFLDHGLLGYGENRNRPDMESSSRLSPHLRFGEISPRQIWHAATAAVASRRSKATKEDLDKLLSEIGWRDFSYHLLFYNPELARKAFQAKFDAFPYEANDDALRAWSQGRTGYPIVDAGIRQLWQTGWMHNRVRMIVASFLTKHLMIDWRQGEDWFWDTLVDADPASNAASWQWVAGSGADASPYYRVFNPVTQGEKFDPKGDYVKTYVPELKRLPSSLIHRPWEAPRDTLAAAGVRLGETYPLPIIEHNAARARALQAYETVKGERVPEYPHP